MSDYGFRKGTIYYNKTNKDELMKVEIKRVLKKRVSVTLYGKCPCCIEKGDCDWIEAQNMPIRNLTIKVQNCQDPTCACIVGYLLYDCYGEFEMWICPTIEHAENFASSVN